MPLRPRLRRALVPAALSCAAALAVAGCSGSGAPGSTSGITPAGSASAPPAAVSAPHWHSCSVQGESLQCARLAVPLDYRRPAGRKITLALSMVPATAPAGQRQGDLLVNPGGPGASGLSLAAQVGSGLDPSVAARYNIIGFDPRGVGSSDPALHCQPSFFRGVRPDYIPASRADERALKDRARGYAAGCEHRYGWLLPYLTTASMARDMDTIRASLHQQKISYFGYSYGTYLGQVYATMFGRHLHRMVLDSIVDPRGVWYADNIAQDYAFQGRFRAFFGWVAAGHSVYRLGSTAAQVQRSWYRIRARLAAHPISGPDGPMIGPDEFDDTFLQGGYSNSLWPGLASALSAYARTGATGDILRQYQEFGVQDENQFAIYNAVECSDVKWPRNWAKWDADTRRVYRKAPFQAWDNAWFNAACAYWPVTGPARPLQIRGAGLPGILMLQGTLDAATPYGGALAARRLLPSARLVAVSGGGNHGQSLTSPPNTCVDRYLNGYLSSGALPGGGGLVSATCRALPPPSAGG